MRSCDLARARLLGMVRIYEREICEVFMRWDHRYGRRKRIADHLRTAWWTFITVLTLAIIIDALFFQCRGFIELLIWTWGER